MKMKNVYVGVTAFLGLGIILFVASFILLDQAKHKTFYFLVSSQGRETGTIRVDRFMTEDKHIYKSLADMPFNPVYTEYRSRLDLGKEYGLEDYARQRRAGHLTELAYLRNTNGLVSFVSRFQSKFACVENIPIRRETFVFEDDAPMTYMPIIENYNFSKGRSQGFNVLTCQPSSDLPPMKRFMIFTSIKDDYIKVGARNIKCENLLLRTRDFPQGAVWVAKSDRSIIRIELPARGITITRSFKPRTITAKERPLDTAGYGSKEIVFKSNGAELSGTLTVPPREARYPAVLLLSGSGPYTRDYQGLFASIAAYLSKNGFSVLRFDRRGTGASKGDATSSTTGDDLADISAALGYLSSQETVDPKRIALLAHDRGTYSALRTAAENASVKGLVLLAPSLDLNPASGEKAKAMGRLAASSKWPDDYLGLVIRSMQETDAKVKNSGGNWVNILGKRCFLKEMKDALETAPIDIIPKVRVPVLILQGRKDEDVAAETAAAIDGALASSGNPGHTLTYYGYLGHFFGRKVNDGERRIYYEVDEDVLGNIKGWLEKAMPEDAKKLD